MYQVLLIFFNLTILWHAFIVQEAIALLQSTIDHKQDRYGDLSPPVAETWKIIGNSYLSTGNAEKALQALKKVFSLRFTFVEECLL